MWGPWTCTLNFVCWTNPTCGNQQLGPVWYGILCIRHGSIMSALLSEDKIECGDFWVINWLPWFTPQHLLSCGHHVIIIVWLFGPIRGWLTLLGYPHVSMASSSMLIAATRRCQCLQISMQEFTILKLSQSHHSWQSFPLHIYGLLLRLSWWNWWSQSSKVCIHEAT